MNDWLYVIERLISNIDNAPNINKKEKQVVKKLLIAIYNILKNDYNSFEKYSVEKGNEKC